MAQFFQRRGRGFQMRTRGTSSSASNSTERVLNRSAAVVSVNRRCRLCFGRFATTLDFQLFQQYRPIRVISHSRLKCRSWSNNGHRSARALNASVAIDPYATSAILHSASNRRPSGASSGGGSRDYREMKKPRSILSWQTQHTQRLRERSPERLLAIDAG